MSAALVRQTVEQHLEAHRIMVAEAIASVRTIAPDDAEGFQNAVGRAGRMHGPAMLWDWWDVTHRCQVAPAALRSVVVDVWTGADFPERLLSPRSVWVELFQQADYPVPSEPLTLYRGTLPGRRRGMAWTSDLERAKRFANGLYSNGRYVGGEAYVYTVIATPDVVLCDVDAWEGANGRGECEIVVNPFRLGRTAVLR